MKNSALPKSHCCENETGQYMQRAQTCPLMSQVLCKGESRLHCPHHTGPWGQQEDRAPHTRKAHHCHLVALKPGTRGHKLQGQSGAERDGSSQQPEAALPEGKHCVTQALVKHEGLSRWGQGVGHTWSSTPVDLRPYTPYLFIHLSVCF